MAVPEKNDCRSQTSMLMLMLVGTGYQGHLVYLLLMIGVVVVVVAAMGGIGSAQHATLPPTLFS